MLKGQDIVILLKILSAMTLSEDNHISLRHQFLTQSKLATHLCMSPSEVNAGMKRLLLSGLIGPVPRENAPTGKIFLPIKAACEECLIFGVKYFLPVELGVQTRGIVTSYAAPIFEKLILKGDDLPPVWPHVEGEHRGQALEPLYRSVPSSLIHYPDKTFYDLLVLIDAIRSGRARERQIAVNLLKKKLNETK